MLDGIRKVPLSYWAKSAASGAGGGTVIAVAAMTACGVVGQGFWYPANLVATTAGYAPPGHDFAGAVSATGLGLHILNAALWGLFYGLLVGALAPRLALERWAHAALAGLGFGILAWLVAGLAFAPGADALRHALNPWAYFAGYLAFGGATAALHFAWTRMHELKVTFAPEIPAREGIFR